MGAGCGPRSSTLFNADFYRVDTALVVPQVLEGTGPVGHRHGRRALLTFDELLVFGLIEADIIDDLHLNPVGGDLVGHARLSAC